MNADALMTVSVVGPLKRIERRCRKAQNACRVANRLAHVLSPGFRKRVCGHSRTPTQFRQLGERKSPPQVMLRLVVFKFLEVRRVVWVSTVFHYRRYVERVVEFIWMREVDFRLKKDLADPLPGFSLEAAKFV